MDTNRKKLKYSVEEMNELLDKVDNSFSSSIIQSNEIDLNEIFHLNVSYNFDLLKNVLDGVLKTQKATTQELNDLKESNRSKDEKIEK